MRGEGRSQAMQVDQYAYQLPARVVADHVAAADRAGVDGWFVAESNQDPFLTCATAAAASSRITVGTGVAIAFARTPMSVAYLAHGMQDASSGRFVLGLGTQVQAHVERRFSMPWGRPAARMQEFVAAYHAIWDCWEGAGDLRFDGEFYQHTLMPDAFAPPRGDWGRPPIWLAGVGPRMVALAGEVADGLICHPLSGASYVADVLGPQMRAAAGAKAEDRTLSANVLVATGPTEEALGAEREAARRQVGFYSSTPAYRTVLAHHGLDELHVEAHQLVRAQRWDDLASVVDDSVLDTFVVSAEPSEVGARVAEHYAGIGVDRVVLNTQHQFDATEWRNVLSALHGADVQPREQQ